MVSELLWVKEKAGSGRQYDCVSLLSLGKPSSSMHYSQGHCCKPKRANKNYKTVRVRIMFIFLIAELKARGDLSSALPAVLWCSESVSRSISLPTKGRGSPLFFLLICGLQQWHGQNGNATNWLVASVTCSVTSNKAEDEALQNPSVGIPWPRTMI